MPRVSYEDSIKYAEKQSGIPRPAPGRHAFVVMMGRSHEKKENGNLSMCLALRMLKDPDNDRSFVGPVINKYVSLPLVNSDIEGHAPSDKAGRDTCAWLSLFYPDEVYSYPQWDRNTGSRMFKGAPIANEEEADANYEAYMSGLKKAVELWGENGEGFETLVGFVFYADLSFQNDFPNFRDMHVGEPKWDLSETHVTYDVATELKEVSEPVPVPTKKTRARGRTRK